MTPLNNLFYIDEMRNTQHFCEELFIENKNRNEKYWIRIINRADVEGMDLDEDCIAYLRIEDRKGERKNSKITKNASLHFHAIKQQLLEDTLKKKDISEIR